MQNFPVWYPFVDEDADERFRFSMDVLLASAAAPPSSAASARVSAAAAAAAAATPGDVHGDGAAPCHGKGVCERVSRV